MKPIYALIVLLAIFITQTAAAQSRGQFGINAGAGVPFLAQGGANIYFSDNLGVDIDYGVLDLTVGQAKAKLQMPSALLKWHPFSGAFFIGAGVGQETLTSTATDAATSQKAEIKIKAMTGIAKAGWMWGSNDGGFWFGVDASYVSPTNPTTEITSALPSTADAYQDAKKQSDKFGKKAYPNVTIVRIGYLF